MLGKLIEFRRMRILPTQYMPCELDHGDLHAEADAKVGDFVRAGILCGDDHALNAAVAEAAGDEDTCAAAENGLRVFLRQLRGIDPVDIDDHMVCRARVEQRFLHGQICVVQFCILADQSDGHMAVGGLDARNHLGPRSQIRRAAV